MAALKAQLAALRVVAEARLRALFKLSQSIPQQTEGAVSKALADVQVQVKAALGGLISNLKKIGGNVEGLLKNLREALKSLPVPAEGRATLENAIKTIEENLSKAQGLVANFEKQLDGLFKVGGGALGSVEGLAKEGLRAHGKLDEDVLDGVGKGASGVAKLGTGLYNAKTDVEAEVLGKVVGDKLAKEATDAIRPPSADLGVEQGFNAAGDAAKDLSFDAADAL